MYTGENLASYQDARVALRGIAGVEDHQFRLLVRAVLASLVLHALLLYALPILKEVGRVSAPPLVARLAKPKPPEPPKAEPMAPRPLVPRAASSAKAVPQPPAPAPVAPVLSVEPAKQAAEPVFTAPAASQATTARTDLASAPVASGPDPGSVARFRIELMEIAGRYKRYPRIAQDNHWEGRVELRIAFAENGAISSLTVKKGAGRAVLDDEAQAMIRSAQPQATIPPALRGKAFTLEITVDFFLKDEAR